MSVLKEWDCKVLDDTDYTIKIVVGDGQKGNSAFKDLQGNYIHGREELEHPLGAGAGLTGKTITISTMVTDVNAQTNNVSVSYLLNGELIEADENPVAREAEEENGSVYVTAKITFTS